MSCPTLQPELRTLEIMDVVPEGHFGLLVTNDRFAPHLRPGEIAIVDTNDTERTFGELYVIDLGPDRRTGGQRRLRIAELIKGFGTGGKPCTVGIWYAFSLKRDVDLGEGVTSRMVDGPLRFDCWPQYCRGRVIGVMVPR